MQRRRLFLILAAVLAVAWTAWLGYQALTTADPIVVSRPQVMAAPVVVVAELTEPAADPRTARVTRIYRGDDVLGAKENKPKALTIQVRGLQGVASGLYILALRESAMGEFEVMPLPLSPGFRDILRGNKPPIYPATKSTELQVREALRQFQRALKK
jgi:hypothetical protein